MRRIIQFLRSIGRSIFFRRFTEGIVSQTIGGVASGLVLIFLAYLTSSFWLNLFWGLARRLGVLWKIVSVPINIPIWLAVLSTIIVFRSMIRDLASRVITAFTVHSKEEAESLAKFQVLASLSYVKGSFFSREKQYPSAILLPLNNYWGHPQLEQYRRLRHILLRENKTSYLISSPEARSGKTTICINLGIVLAIAGQKVIIVDFDLRRPRLHWYMELKNEVGVTSVLGKLLLLDSAIQNSPVHGLSVLTSGPLPMNNVELLGSDMIRELLLTLKNMGYFILIDTPPTLFIDAEVCAPLVDGTLVVVAHKETRKRSLIQTITSLKESGAHVSGLILSKFKHKFSDFDYYEYGTYYSSIEDNKPHNSKL